MKVTSKKQILMAVSGILLFSVCSLSYAAEEYSPFFVEGQNASTKSNATDTVSYSTSSSSLLNLEDAPASTETHPFSGSEEQMDELKKLEPIQNDLQVAVDVHNVINKLKGFQNIQKQYNDMLLLHNRSLELLKESEQCTLNYIGRYFNDPVKVWSGKNLINDPANHDLREGLSAWAIAMFETAKSAEVSPIDVSDVVSVDTTNNEVLDSDGNVLDVTTDVSSSTSTVGVEIDETETSTNLEELHQSSDSKINELEASSGGNYFKEPSRQEELEAEDRKTDLISKDIGIEVALWMADYLSGKKSSGNGAPAWNTSDLGGVKKRFPVWTDQKTFYGQYLNRKYKNIKKYIENYEVPQSVRNKIANTIMERQELYMSKAEAEITKAAIQARNTARKIRDEKVIEAREEYEKSLNGLGAMSQKIAQINKETQEKIDAITAEINSASKLADSYMTQISDITEDNNRLQRELDETKEELKNYVALGAQKQPTEEDINSYEDVQKEIETEIKDIEEKIKNQNTEKETLQQLYNEQTAFIEKKKQERTQVESDGLVAVGKVNKIIGEQQKELLTEFYKKVKKYDEELEKKNKSIDAAEIAAKAAIGSKSMVTAQQIISQTDMAIEVAKADAIENISKTYNAIMGLGDDLYRGIAHPTVVLYHQSLIDSLRGEDSNVGGVILEKVKAKVHDLSNFNTDIVISSTMDEQMKEMYIEDYRNSVKNTEIILEFDIFDELLEQIDSSADTQFFVGLTPKTEDFRAPKAMPDLNLPPLREYVRLDYIDLQNIGKDSAQIEAGEYKQITEIIAGKPFEKTVWVKTEEFPITLINKEKFLSYGAQIPEIWKLMLKDKAFVDSDFYLTADMNPDKEEAEQTILDNPLSIGGEMSVLYRGGVYPCLLKNIKSTAGVCEADGVVSKGEGIVDVSIIDKGKTNANEYFMGLGFVSGEQRQELLKENLPVCQEISAMCKSSLKKTENGWTLSSEPYLTLLNKEEESGTHSDSFVTLGTASELGSIINVYNGKMLLSGIPVNNVIGYSPYMQAVVNYGVRMEERGNQEDAPELSAAEEQNDDIYVRAQYNNNQVGDFLDHVELEQKYKQALDELEEQVKEMKDELYTNLRAYGFEPSPEFDISKEEDYNLAVKQLKNVKQNYMKTAKSGIDSIEPGDSEVLRDTQNSYSRVYQGLNMDSEALVSMSMDIDDLNEFSETLKTATTNNNVDETYEENGEENVQDILEAMKPAYCAAY